LGRNDKSNKNKPSKSKTNLNNLKLTTYKLLGRNDKSNKSKPSKSKPNLNNLKLTTHFSQLKVHGWILAAIFLVAFGVTEFIIYHISAAYGLALYFIILFAIIIYSTIDTDKYLRQLWMAIGLVPLIRIVSLVEPVIQVSTIYWYIIIALPVLLCIYTIARNLHYSIDDIGLNTRLPLVQFIIAVTGIGLGAIDYFILKPQPLVEGPFAQLIFPAAVLLVFNGLVEELAFRGVMQRAANVLGSLGWILIAAIYAILQVGFGSILHIIFILAVGIYFGFVVKKTNSIFGVSLAHGLMSIIVYLVMPKIF